MRRLFIFLCILVGLIPEIKGIELADTLRVSGDKELYVIAQSSSLKNQEMVLFNTDSSDLYLQLEIVNPYISTTLCCQQRYPPSKKKKKNQTVDSLIAFEAVDNHRNHLYNIILPKQTSLSLQLQISNPYPVPQNYSILLWDKDHRTILAKREDLGLAVFFTINFFFLLIFGLHILISRLYGLWTFFGYVLLGIIFVNLDVGVPFWNYFLSYYEKGVFVLLVSNLYLAAGIAFVNYLFDSIRKYSKTYQFFILLLGILLIMVFGYIVLWFRPIELPQWFIQLNFAILIIGTLSVFYLVLLHITFEKERGESFWFMLGFLLHGGSIIVLLLELVGILKKNYLMLLMPADWRNSLLTFHTSPILLVGMIFEIGIVFVIMVYRVKWLYEKNIKMLHIIALKKERNVSDFVLGIESERKRIAQDIHDSLGVQLSAIKIQMSLLENQNTDIEKIINELDNTSKEVRQITHNLISPTLERIGLEAAIQELVTKIQQSQKIQISFYKNIDIEQFKPEVKIIILRILQELLNNTLKHAKATEVNIQLLRSEIGMLLTVEDNGIGFDTQKKNYSGIGLSNIKNRVALLDGQMIVESAIGAGTYISIELPPPSNQA